MLKLYHTYKKKLVDFKPIKDKKVGMYNCGPTVYDTVHVGNLQMYVFNDVLRRSLEFLGYEVTQVMNITDVGHLTMTDVQKENLKKQGKEIEVTDTDEGLDRMEKAAQREGISVWDVAKKYTEAIFGKDYDKKKTFEKDGAFGKMNILKPDFMPTATGTIDEQIKMIEELFEKGYVYKTKQAVYFDIQKFDKYEELIGQKLTDMKLGARADSSDPDRKHPADFRLWQLGQPDHAMQWDSPWGKGFPGWHIECSAMSKMYLGETFDIHTGGEDHIKVHHPAEIAQSESVHEKTMANFWLHKTFLTVDGKRMGKSLGNMFTLADLKKKGFDPLDLRYFYHQAHYRSKQDFSWKALKAAKAARGKLNEEVFRLKSEIKSDESICINPEWKKKFIEALENDINMPQALAVMWDYLKTDDKSSVKYATLVYFDQVFGLRLDEVTSSKRKMSKMEVAQIETLIKERESARERKDWEEADEVRDVLKTEFNVTIEDSADGVKWYVNNGK